MVAAALIVLDPGGSYDLPVLAAFGYASLILSFLGGMWWSFAMKRVARQASLAALAVVPSLLPSILLPLAAVTSWTVPLVLLGSTILLTLLVDRRLARSGEAPEGWMSLRVPLSIGLGGLTIVAGILAGS